MFKFIVTKELLEEVLAYISQSKSDFTAAQVVGLVDKLRALVPLPPEPQKKTVNEPLTEEELKMVEEVMDNGGNQ